LYYVEVVVANLLGKLLRPSKLREEQNGLNTVELNIVNNETTLVVSCTQDGTDTGRTTDGEPATAHAGARRAGARHAGARRAGAASQEPPTEEATRRTHTVSRHICRPMGRTNTRQQV
jgi:hypothetical protein